MGALAGARYDARHLGRWFFPRPSCNLIPWQLPVSLQVGSGTSVPPSPACLLTETSRSFLSFGAALQPSPATAYWPSIALSFLCCQCLSLSSFPPSLPKSPLSFPAADLTPTSRGQICSLLSLFSHLLLPTTSQNHQPQQPLHLHHRTPTPRGV